MAQRQAPKQQPQAPAPRAGVRDGTGDQDVHLCTCCAPPNPLVLRPDLGTLPGGRAEYALCVLHQPDPVVYRNRGDGVYVAMEGMALSPAGDLLDSRGAVVASAPGGDFDRLLTVDDDDEPGGGGGSGGGGGGGGADPGRASRPSTYHVDLTEDDFYR